MTSTNCLSTRTILPTNSNSLPLASGDSLSLLSGRRRYPATGLRMKDAQWVEPKLTAKVRHLAGAKYLRHAVVKALE